MKPLSLFGKAAAFLFLFLFLALLPGIGRAQAVFTWIGTTTSTVNWNSTNWAVVSGTGAAAYPTAGDTATFSGAPASTNYFINYDVGETGQLGTLNMIGTSGSGAVYLNLYRSLTITGGGALTEQVTGGHMNLTFNADNILFTIGDGTNASTFTFGYDNAAEGGTSQQLYVNGTHTGDKVVIAGASTLNWINSNTSGANPSLLAPIEVQSNGALNLQVNSGTGKYTMGDLTIDSGGQVTMSGTTAGSIPMYIQGNVVANGKLTGFTSGGLGNNTNGVVLSQQTAAGTSGTQSISFGTGNNAFDFTLRPGLAGTIVSGLTTTDNYIVSSSATGSALNGTNASYATTGTNIIDSINFFGNSSAVSNTIILQLGSDLNYGGNGSIGPITYGAYTSGGVVTDTIDLNGHTYNVGGKSYGAGWSAAGSSASSTISFINSAGSASPGVFKAAYVNLGTATNAANTVIGSYVTLQSVNTLTLNTLSAATGTTGTIDPTSTFLYTGVGNSTVISNRNIGNVTVGTGSTASILSLGTAITAAGVTTVNASGVLDLYNGTGTGSSTQGTEGSYALTTAGLSGAGTIENKTIGTGTAISSTTLTVNNTGTAGIATSNTYSGAITDGGTSTSRLNLTLASTNTGTQTLSGANTYSGTTTVSGGKLLVANTTGSATGSGAITVASGASFGGSGIVNPTGTNKMTVSGNLILGTAGSAATSLTVSAASNTFGAGMVDLTGAGLNFNLGSGNTSSSLKLTSAYTNEVAGLSGNTFSFTDLTGGALSLGEYTLVLSDSGADPFQGLSLGTLSGFTLTGLTGYTARLELNQVSGNYAIQLDVTAVPEPSVVALMLAVLGLACLPAARRLLLARSAA